MAQELKRQGYPVVRTNQATTAPAELTKESVRFAGRFSAIGRKWGMPIAVINGHAKAHPTMLDLTQVWEHTSSEVARNAKASR